MEKIRMIAGALGVYLASVTSTAVATAASATTLQSQSAQELAHYIASGGAGVVC